MEIKIENVRDAFKLFETKLKEASASLDQVDQVGFEILTTLDGYNLTHPRGVYGLLFNGKQFLKRDDSKGNVVFMKQNLMIGVVSIIRFFDVKGADVDKMPMMPVEYTEVAEDVIAGIEVFNSRPEYERKIVPVRTELIDEEKGVWKYLTTFEIPKDFWEVSFRPKN